MTATAIKDASVGGTISYNGFTFGGAGSTPPTYRLRGTPVYDDAGRAVTHVKYHLEVATVIHSDGEESTGDFVRGVRERLSRPGRALELLDIGLGDTRVKHGGSHPDVIWGARPRVVSLQPVGGVLAWQIEWQCEFCISESSLRRGGANHWLSFNYEAKYSLDELGFTTRTIRGQVQIVQVRAAGGSPTVRKTADQVRDRIQIVIPTGFRRRSSDWRESNDKSRLDFVVVDEQLRHDAYPAGIVDADVDYRVENRGPGFSRFSASLTGWMETAPGVAKSLAVQTMLAMAQDKMRRLQDDVGGTGTSLVVPRSFSVRHKQFTRRSWLQADFDVVSNRAQLLAAGGMWTPVSGSDYRQWARSLKHIWGNRGTAGLRSRPQDGVVIDLIDHPTDHATIRASQSGVSQSTDEPMLPRLIPVVLPATSWLEYQVRIRLARQASVSIHTLARRAVRCAAPACRVREVHGAEQVQVALEGVAVRLQFVPTSPVLNSVGGRPAYERKRSEELEQLASYSGIPAYRLRWSIVYDVDSSVSQVQPPENPTLPAG